MDSQWYDFSLRSEPKYLYIYILTMLRSAFDVLMRRVIEC